MTTEVLGNTASANWVPTDESFGARLALIRWQMGWNVKEAALACGVPAASWRTWELDRVQPRNIVQVARQISERTGCDYGWLLAGARLRAGGGEPIPRYAPWRQLFGLRPPDHPGAHRRPPGRARTVRMGALVPA